MCFCRSPHNGSPTTGCWLGSMTLYRRASPTQSSYAGVSHSHELSCIFSKYLIVVSYPDCMLLITFVCLYEHPGGAFCQLMNWLFPKSIDLSSVQFLCNNMVDAIPNYRLLNAAFKKVGVLRVSIVTKVVNG